MKSHKDFLSIDACMQNIKKKKVVDYLALINHFLSDDKIIIHALNGLSFDFKDFCEAFRARDSPILLKRITQKFA